jgi:glycosidase
LESGKKITKITQIPESEFDKWRDMGFKWVWFMGIWQLGPYGLEHDRTNPDVTRHYDEILPGWTKEDVIGSPYAVLSYTVNTEIGTLDDIRWLRQQLNKRGMKLMVDFVPNHSAWDAPEIVDKPNYFIRSPKGAPIDRKFYRENGIAYGRGIWCDPWTDVAQFNYFDTECRNSRINIVKMIAEIADGCRCDMAHLVTNDAFGDFWQKELQSWGYTRPSTEFWTDVIRAVKSIRKEFIFMAETYSDFLPRMISQGFDYVYDKEPLDKLVYKDIHGFKELIRWTSMEHKSHTAHFTENHDEDRTTKKFWNYNPMAKAAAAAVLSLPGMRFIYQDQWDGLANRIGVHLRRATPEPKRTEIYDFYMKLFSVYKKDAFINGDFKFLEVNGDQNMLTWKYTKGSEHYLVAVNFGEGKIYGNVVLDDAPLTGDLIKVEDIISGEVYERNPREMRTSGLFVALDHYQVQIFRY